MAGIGGVSPVASYLSAERDEATAAQRYIRTDATAQHDLKEFQSRASSVHSADDLMKDYSLEKVVLNAYGLGNLQGQPAVVRALLTQDPTSPNSLAMKSGNASWRAFANDFASLGRNGGQESEATSISMSGPVGLLSQNNLASGAGASGQSYSPPPVTAHTADGQPYQIGLSWAQSGSDPSLWTVTPYASSPSAGHVAGVADGAFSVKFNSDGSLGSVTSPSGTVIDQAGTEGQLDLTVSYDGVAQSVSLDLGTIGQKNGVSLTQSSFDLPQDSVSTPVLSPSSGASSSASSSGTSAGVISLPTGTMVGNLNGNGQGFMTAPAQLRETGSDGKESVSPVSAQWVQASSVPPVWQVQLVDPATGTAYSDAYKVRFDDKGQIASVTDPGKQADNGTTSGADNGGAEAGTPVSADNLTAQINGQVWRFDISGASLNNGVLSSQPDVRTPLSAQYSSTPFTADLLSRISENYELNAFEGSGDNKANGVGDALYFTRKIGTVQSVEQLMSDPRLLRVAEVVSGYDPDVIGGLDFDQQLRIMKKSVNLEDFSTPQSAQRYVERYLAILQTNPQYIDNDQPSTILDLFGGESGGDYNDQIISLFS